MSRSTFNGSFNSDRSPSLDKQFSDDLREKLIEAILLSCGLVSVFTTFGIVLIIFQVTFEFFQQVSLASTLR